MRRVLFLILAALAATTVLGQKLEVSGTVINGATNQPVAGASIRTGDFSLVTNDDGFFVLKSDRRIDTIVVSHLGFRSQRIAVDGIASEPLKIRLMPAAIQLREVLVTAEDPRQLVEEAISRIPDNYSREAELLHCFYRETAMKRQHYICVAEGVIDMYKSPYGDGVRRDRVAISKGRRLLSATRGDTLTVKVLGGPVAPVQLDLVKDPDLLLNTEDLDCYDMTMGIPTSINGRMQHVVSIVPRVAMPYALYFGTLYIDQETLAFTRAELSLDVSDREKATNMMLVKKPMGVRFRPKELSLLVDYRTGNDGVTRISYLRTTFRFNCDWRRKLFATSFTACCEMAVTSRGEGPAVPIRGRDSFDQRDAFFDKVDFFRDPEFWQDYNIIEPTESLDRAVLRLLKKY